MRQCLGEKQTASEHTHPPSRRGAGYHHTKDMNTSLRHRGTTTGIGVLLSLLVAWYGVTAHSAPAPLLAIGIGVLSWLVAVVIVAALLLGGLLLLKALVHQYWPQDQMSGGAMVDREGIVKRTESEEAVAAEKLY
jgi:hypothetical protein